MAADKRLIAEGEMRKDLVDYRVGIDHNVFYAHVIRWYVKVHSSISLQIQVPATSIIPLGRYCKVSISCKFSQKRPISLVKCSWGPMPFAT